MNDPFELLEEAVNELCPQLHALRIILDRERAAYVLIARNGKEQIQLSIRQCVVEQRYSWGSVRELIRSWPEGSSPSKGGFGAYG